MLDNDKVLFADLIGQTRVINLLKRNIEGAKAQGQRCPDLLLRGLPGLGKTTMAHAVANEFGSDMHPLSADESVRSFQIAKIVQPMQPFDVLFVDEVHRLRAECLETLRGLIDEVREAERHFSPGLPDPSQDGSPKGMIPISMILATDQPGKLTKALLSRFPLRPTLRPYAEDEIDQIIRRNAAALGVVLTRSAAKCLAVACRGNPRKACHHVENIKRHFGAERTPCLRERQIIEYLSDHGIDHNGLSDDDRQFILCLARHRGRGVACRTLESAVGLDWRTIATDVEPWFVEHGWVGQLASGRRFITENGMRRFWELTAQEIEENHP